MAWLTKIRGILSRTRTREEGRKPWTILEERATSPELQPRGYESRTGPDHAGNMASSHARPSLFARRWLGRPRTGGLQDCRIRAWAGQWWAMVRAGEASRFMRPSGTPNGIHADGAGEAAIGPRRKFLPAAPTGPPALARRPPGQNGRMRPFRGPLDTRKDAAPAPGWGVFEVAAAIGSENRPARVGHWLLGLHGPSPGGPAGPVVDLLKDRLAPTGTPRPDRPPPPVLVSLPARHGGVCYSYRETLPLMRVRPRPGAGGRA